MSQSENVPDPGHYKLYGTAEIVYETNTYLKKFLSHNKLPTKIISLRIYIYKAYIYIYIKLIHT